MRNSVKIALVAAATAAGLTACGGSSAPVQIFPVMPPAQVRAACAYTNSDCPLGHAFKQYGKTWGDGVTETYTVTASQVASSATSPDGVGVTVAGKHFVSVKFTIRGLAGDGGTNDSAGGETDIIGSDGKTYIPAGDDLHFDPVPGSVQSGWVGYDVMPNGVTPHEIEWGIQAGNVISWQPGSGQ